MKLVLIDLKRVFSGWGTAALCILAPLCVVLALSLVAIPMFATYKMSKFNAMICDEDGSEPVREFITQLVNSKALRDLIALYPVDTPEQGLALLNSGDATIFIHIPPHMFEDMQNKRPVQLDIYGGPGHELEVSVVRNALSDSLAAVGKSENILELAYWSVRDAGVSEKEGERFFSDTLDYAIEQYMSRREVYGDMGMVTPVGDLVPVQYYMAAVYTLFTALAALPLARKTAGDLGGTLLRRGVLSGQNAARFFAARFTSGAALELLLLLTLIPVGLVLRLANYTCSAELAGSLPALLFAIVLVACCFSALATAIPLLARSRDTAAWAGFILILLLAFCSGLLVPERMLPDAMQTAAEFLPLAAGMHLISSALFRFDAISCARDAALILLWGLLFAGLGYGGYRKKERTV